MSGLDSPRSLDSGSPSTYLIYNESTQDFWARQPLLYEIMILHLYHENTSHRLHEPNLNHPDFSGRWSSPTVREVIWKVPDLRAVETFAAPRIEVSHGKFREQDHSQKVPLSIEAA